MMVRKNIFLIDRSEVLAECMADTLRMEGYVVYVAGSSGGVMALLEEYVPDLIIIDLAVPDVKGAFIEGIRRQLMPHVVPVVAISADVRNGGIQRDGTSGVNFFTTLPFDDDLFLQVIGSILEETV